MMRVSQKLAVCECCALVIANGDDSGCRDYHNHTHPPCWVPANTVPGGEETERSDTWTCDGCGTEMAPFSMAHDAFVLEPVKEKSS